MRHKLIELKIPCGWEIIINNFYDCECNMTFGNYKDKNSRILLQLERDVSIESGEHFIIILEWLSTEEKNTYRITAALHGLDGKKHLNKFETGDCNFVKEVFNNWIEELSQFLVDSNEVALKLGYIIYSELYNNKIEEYPLMPLMIPGGWNIISNCFYDLDCTQSNLDRRLFSADMLFIKTSGINTSKGEYIISLDWLPYNNPEGTYVIQVAFVDFGEVIRRYESRDRLLIKEKIFSFMDIIGSCNNKGEVIKELSR